MQQQQRFHHWFSRGLALLLTIALGLGLAQPAQAATTTISDAPSCVAFGGRWEAIFFGICRFREITIATGDTLITQADTSFDALTNNGTLTNNGNGNSVHSVLTNNAGATINISGSGFTIYRAAVNYGTINVNFTRLGFDTRDTFTNASTGQITVHNGATMSVNAQFINQGTILVECGGSFVIGAGTFSGNPPQIIDCTPPSVTVNQAAGQADPSNRNPVLFTANFSEAVTNFTAADVTLSGTANRTGATITLSGGPSNYTISVTGLAGNGTVIASLAANVATDGAGYGNTASTSTDNTVTYETTPPTATPSQSPAATANGWNNSDVTVSWNWTDNAGGVGIDPANCTASSVSSGEGRLTLAATCQDRAGNVGSANYLVQVDKTVPTITTSVTKADGTPYLAGSWSNQAVTVHFVFADSSSGVQANSPDRLISMEGATSSVDGTVIDNAGNSASTSFGPIQLDFTAPDTTINSQPANPSSSDSATFAFSGSDTASGIISSEVASFACKLDSAAFAPCTSPQAYSNLAAGSHTFQVQAVDSAGNVDPTPASYTWNVQTDSTAPTASPAQAPAANAGGWNNSDVTMTWNWADDAGGLGIDHANCTTSSTSSGEGTLTLTATCQDLAGNQASASYTVQVDKTAPSITASTTNADGTPYISPDFTNQDITVHFTCSDDGAGIATCPADQTINAEGSLPTVQGTATDNAGNSADAFAGPFQVDKTKPMISGSRSPAANANGWNNSDVTVSFTCADTANGSTIGSDTVAGATVISEGANQAVTNTGACVDVAGNVADAATVNSISIDKTAPVVAVTGMSNGASYTLGSVPSAGCSTTDALSGVATQAALSITGGNGDGTGSFTATCNGATDNAGNSAAAVSVSYSVTAVVADACTTTALRDNFNRANGGLGSNWAGVTDQSFYKIASNKVDVQLGGPVVWKPTSYGVNQAAFVTLSTLDGLSPAQGVLLKVQSGTIPNAGAIAVVYDNLAKAVRVSTLRLNTPAWTVYAPTPATFVNGDKLLGCAKADGTVRVYKNNSLLTTVTLNAADQSFFNAKGGKIGLWTVAALNAFFDDFGGGALTGVSSAALDATTVPDEVADDGAEIAVGVAPDAVVDALSEDAASNHAAGTFANRLFLAQVSR